VYISTNGVCLDWVSVHHCVMQIFNKGEIPRAALFGAIVRREPSHRAHVSIHSVLFLIKQSPIVRSTLFPDLCLS